MTDRYYVRDPPDAETGLAVGFRVIMDLYVRAPRNVVVVASDLTAARRRLATLVGSGPAAALEAAPQPFAGHEMRLLDASGLKPAALADEHVLVLDAGTAALEAVDAADGLTAIVAVPPPGTAAEAWITQHGPVLLEARPPEGPSGAEPGP